MKTIHKIIPALTTNEVQISILSETSTREARGVHLPPAEALALTAALNFHPSPADLISAGLKDPYPIVSRLNKKISKHFGVSLSAKGHPAMHYGIIGGHNSLHNFLAIFGKN